MRLKQEPWPTGSKLPPEGRAPWRARVWPAALLVLAGMVLSGEQPQLYRWKDSKGREHVTNTPPPSGSTPLDVPPLENKKDSVQPPTSAPRPSPFPEKALGLSPKEAAFWQSLGPRLREARVKGDQRLLESAAQEVVNTALWGDGIWALTLLPLATLALLTLLGWWVGSGLRGLGGPTVTLIFFLTGLGLAHISLVRFVYGPQAQRLQRAGVALRAHLLEPATPPSAPFRDLQGDAAALDEALRFTAPPWRFPERVAVFTNTLRRVLVTP